MLFRRNPAVAEFASRVTDANTELARRINEAKKQAGSINFGLGPAGCGKTHTLLRISLQGAYYYRIPWFGYDSNGDVMRHLRTIHGAYKREYERQKRLRSASSDAQFEQLRAQFEAEDAKSYDPPLSVQELRARRAESFGFTPAQYEVELGKQRIIPLNQKHHFCEELLKKAYQRLAFLAKCMDSDHLFSGPARLPGLLAHVRDSIREGIGEASRLSDDELKKIGPRYRLFIDEAGAVRHEDEDFWKEMRQARNARVTIDTTGHRTKDLHPAALANMRTACLWRPTAFNAYELGAIKVPASQCAEPKSGMVHFVVCDHPKVKVFRVSESLYPSYPPELIVPAQPTIGTASGF